MNIMDVGNGKVYLLQGGGKCFTDVAARFTRSEKSVGEIIATPYDRQLVDTIIESGHLAATEFDYYIFGIEGYARVTEVQLVRKRLASYLIKSGRYNKKGKRSFDIVLPNSCKDFTTEVFIPSELVKVDGVRCRDDQVVRLEVNPSLILSIIEGWYNEGVNQGLPEEDLRYLKPQATEFKAIVGMNAHSLMDWFKIRMCKNAQTEIRDLACKMYDLCLGSAYDLFKDAGPSCKVLGYCPENKKQNPECVGKRLTKEQALEILSKYTG